MIYEKIYIKTAKEEKMEKLRLKKQMPTFDELNSKGNKLGSELEGTVIFYSFAGEEYAVLQDNTVIFKKDWDKN